jgi:hypothetical protein
VAPPATSAPCLSRNSQEPPQTLLLMAPSAPPLLLTLSWTRVTWVSVWSSYQQVMRTVLLTAVWPLSAPVGSPSVQSATLTVHLPLGSPSASASRRDRLTSVGQCVPHGLRGSQDVSRGTYCWHLTMMAKSVLRPL